MIFLYLVQKALLAQHEEELKDWQNFTDADVSNICIFLPRDLSRQVLCYPSCVRLMDIKALAAYRLCKDKSKSNLIVLKKQTLKNIIGTLMCLESAIGLGIDNTL